MTVDRFDGPPPPEMQPYVNGDYVRYSDYAELEMERDRLISELNTLRTHAEANKALKEAADLLTDLDQGRSIHNQRFPDQRIDGPLWAQIGRVVSIARRAREQGGE